MGVLGRAQCEEANRAKDRLTRTDETSSRSIALTSLSRIAGGLRGAAENSIPDVTTDQGMLAEMASLLQIIERYWCTHFSAGDEIDPLTVLRVRSILAEHRQRYRRHQ